MPSDLVLVTGASGYIATHIVQQLQHAGYRVRGTVRSLNNEEKVKPLKELCPDSKYPLELVEADLLDGASWKSVVNDCTFVIHVASPVPLAKPEDENDVIRPAVDGTLNVLKACKETKTVKRVVITSSIFAILFGFPPSHDQFTEDDWTDITSPNLSQYSTYIKSKTLAERAAWNFIKELPHDEKLELAVLNPGIVTGPVLCGYINTSTAFTKMVLEEDADPLKHAPIEYWPHIDVRDVAQAHIIAMTLPEAAGNRYILSAEQWYFYEVADVILQKFKPQGYNIPSCPSIGKKIKVDNQRMISVLGIQPRDIKDSVIEMCYSIIEKGQIKKSAMASKC